ncbi:hypothetical protein ERH_0267 [Erysipelothrix rhusiopathiae str. Fujisawa]|nr:hypothetical protein ERH_0267 [Erysipelothrix rhusiopathiae str. Fujisawa]
MLLQLLRITICLHSIIHADKAHRTKFCFDQGDVKQYRYLGRKEEANEKNS